MNKRHPASRSLRLHLQHDEELTARVQWSANEEWAARRQHGLGFNELTFVVKEL